jgi:undecaprenyl diphosphate synthase
MDGNGRWAEKRGLPRSEGHSAGALVVKSIVKACIEKNIKVLSVWAFGRDNWARPEAEVTFLMQLFVKTLRSELSEMHQQGIRLRFSGNRQQLSKPLQEQMHLAETLTSNNTQLILNVVISYSGKWDIVQAAQHLARRVLDGELLPEDIDETLFANQLDISDLPDPDLFIRTSGEQRISNFFLWQLAYSELYFCDAHWPDFSELEFEKALLSFAQRERRYGKTSQQLLEDVSYV